MDRSTSFTSGFLQNQVASRAKEAGITADDFSRWLTCARLHAASTLAAEVTFEHYAHVKQMDMARIERLRAQQVAL